VGVAEESGFASYQGVAEDHVGFLADLFVPDHDNPVDAASKISPIPLLIIHGTADSVVPYHHAQQIFAAAKEPKELWTIADGGHTVALGPMRDTYAPRLLQKFLLWVNEPPPAINP